MFDCPWVSESCWARRCFTAAASNKRQRTTAAQMTCFLRKQQLSSKTAETQTTDVLRKEREPPGSDERVRERALCTWSSPEAHSLMCLRTHSMCHAHLYELTAANWTPDVCGGHPVRDVTVTRAKLIISDQRDVPEKMSERSRRNEGKVSEFGSFARVLLNKPGPSSCDALCAFSSSKIKTCNTGTFVRWKVCAGRDDSTARGLCGRMFSP